MTRAAPRGRRRGIAAAWTAAALFVPGSAALGDDVADLAALLEGTYRTVHETHHPDTPQLTDRRMRVAVPALGENVLYWQLNSGPDQRVYRQRLLRLTQDPATGEILQHSFSLAEPGRFVDRFDDAAAFEAIGPADLADDLPAGCELRWQRLEDGWRGYLDPARCVIFSRRHQDYRHIEGEVIVRRDGLQQAERGFAADGRQLFGTAPGEFLRLDRLTPAGAGSPPAPAGDR